MDTQFQSLQLNLEIAVQRANLRGESAITHEHVKNNESVRNMLDQRGIQPEKLAAEEDLQKLKRRMKSEEKTGKTHQDLASAGR